MTMNWWSMLWQTKRSVISSPLITEAAQARLRVALPASWAGISRLAADPPVCGRVVGDRVALIASRRGFANPWHPVLRGRIVPTASGSQLLYRVGWTYMVSVFTAVWLACATTAFLIGAVATLSRVVAGDPQAAGGPATLMAVAGVLILYAITLTTFSSWLSRDEIQTIHAWLARHLDGS